MRDDESCEPSLGLNIFDAIEPLANLRTNILFSALEHLGTT